MSGAGTGAGGSSNSSDAVRGTGRGAGVWVGAALAVLAVVALLVMSSRTPSGEPFAVGSSGPDGYRALAILLRQHGAEVHGARGEEIVDREWDRDDVVVVPVPGYATAVERDSYRRALDAGATVVFGEPLDEVDAQVDDEVEGVESPALPEWFWVDGRTLADLPAEPVDPGVCSIDALDGLGPIDGAFAVPAAVTGEGSTCYGDGESALILQDSSGTGRLVTLASPYLWANARLQPVKEEGGQPLDNAATALRLLGVPAERATEGATDGLTEGVTVTMVDAHAPASAAADGSQDPISLLPVPVKLALVQLVAAFCIYVWWRARRLGRPVAESLPVEIAGSELVVAVGDLLRRKGNPDRAARTLRAETRRALAARLGIPPTASVDALSDVVASRSGRTTAEVRAALTDTPVTDPDTLVRLARTLDALRQEVLDVPAPR